jgi:hypothetical protein
MTNFELIFYASLVFTAAVTFRSSEYWKTFVLKDSSAGSTGTDLSSSGSGTTPTKEDPAVKKKWVDLLSRYLLVYLLATCSDWLQGPYVYALYRDYGYEQHDIAVLFVAGFGSAMVFGTFIGGMADQFGRRRFVIVYGLSYALSCFTKRTCSDFLGGVCVLYSE